MKNYQSLILDVDGVLFDSNTLKQENIAEAVTDFCTAEEKEAFVSYYIFNNGLPREMKIEKYFGQDSEASHAILQRYNQLNRNTLFEAPMTNGALDFIRDWSQKATIWALSGGAEEEVKTLFKKNNINHYFKAIHGGPISKKEHIKKLKLQQPCLYIGDSKIDYETAAIVNADFAFMYEFTQFENWKEFFADKQEILTFKNLEHLQKQLI